MLTAKTCFTAAITFSTVNPKYLNKSLAGADSPKRSIPLLRRPNRHIYANNR